MEAVAMMIFMSLVIGISLAFGVHKTPAMRDEKRYAAGIRLVGLQKYLEALAYFEQIIKKHPHSGVAWSYRAECHLALGDYHQAIMACEKAIQLDYTLAYCYLFKGIALYHLQEYPDARDELSNAIWHFREKHPDAFKYRGLCHYALQNFGLAESDLQRAYRLGDEDAHYILKQWQTKSMRM
ncbi:MAG: tetratricopeptide repeat protein [Microscillaceae bacterium]|jgi:tetratricopeptide (TPR) repeat protein|nr:tetratricopeptide repeat protein [Microscillaceae bacterium]